MSNDLKKLVANFFLDLNFGYKKSYVLIQRVIQYFSFQTMNSELEKDDVRKLK